MHRHMNIRAAGYSDDEDYSDLSDDDFYMGETSTRVKRQQFIKSDKEKWEESIVNAVNQGDVATLKQLLDEAEDIFHIDTPLRGSLNLLMNACISAHPVIVEYLIDKGARVNTDIDSQTPLMYACNSTEDSDQVAKVVEILLAADAIVNISSIYGDTPLIFAAQNGHTKVVEMIVKQASLDATNNMSGNSAIFYAIEKNHYDIVKILLDNGASINIPNRKGYLPRAVAEMHGFEDILKLFPQTEEKFTIPSSYVTFSHYRDMVPGILGPTDTPAYFHQIEPMLTGMDAVLLHEQFAKSKVSLPQFLSMNRNRLAEVGVELPFMQQKVLQGLFEFHSHPWSKKSVPKSKAKQLDTFEVYAILAGDLHQFVVMRSGLIFLLNFDHDHAWPYPEQKHVKKMVGLLDGFRSQLNELKDFVTAIKNKNPEERIGEISSIKIEKLRKLQQRKVSTMIVKCSLALSVAFVFGFVVKHKLRN